MNLIHSLPAVSLEAQPRAGGNEPLTQRLRDVPEMPAPRGRG